VGAVRAGRMGRPVIRTRTIVAAICGTGSLGSYLRRASVIMLDAEGRWVAWGGNGGIMVVLWGG
jgi:hypothetical protein